MALLSQPIHIVFRVDATLSSGSGHLCRCRTLARRLNKHGCDITFICRDHHDSIHNQILAGEFNVLCLPRPVSTDSDSFQSIYSQWLGCDQYQDASDFIDAWSKLDLAYPEFIIIDHYGIDYAWEKQIQKCYPLSKILAIDDLANRKHAVSWLLDSGSLDPWTDTRYKDLLDSDCQLLLGFYYCCLSSDYIEYRNKVCIRRDLARILIFFGGVDSDNWSLMALNALLHPDLSYLKVDVVLGDSAPHLHQIKALVNEQTSWTLHVGIPSLAPLVACSDLAIGASGVHSFERACLGLPALAIAVADNQTHLLDQLNSTGAVIRLTIENTQSGSLILSKFLLDIKNNPAQLQQMSVSAFCLLDAYGANRVSAAMLGITYPVKLRSTILLDMGVYLWWANDPVVRQSSLQTSVITPAIHDEWFQARLVSCNSLMKVLTDDDGLPLGQIRFDRSSETETTALISFSLDRNARGCGLAFQLLSLGLVELHDEWPHTNRLLAYVKSNNLASARVFLRSGFDELDSPDPDVRCFTKSCLN